MSVLPDQAGPLSWAEGDVVVDGVELHVSRTGRTGAPPLVLAHGFSDNGHCWERAASVLAADFDIVAIDARNHGRSATADADAGRQAEDVVAVVAALGLDRPVLMGHSLGARTMALVAAAHPEMPAALVLEDPPWTPDREGSGVASVARVDAVRAYIRSLAEMTDDEIRALGAREHPQWADEEFPAWVAAKRQVRERAVENLAGPGWGETIEGIGCRTLLIHGDPAQGGLVTPEVAARVAATNANVTCRRVDDCGHNIRRENFRGFVAAVDDFLGRR